MTTNLVPDDFSVLFAGTNYVARNDTNGQCEESLSISKKPMSLSSLYRSTMTYPSWSVVNKEVEEANRRIQLVCNPLKNVIYVDISTLDRRLHTRNGLHLNMFVNKYVADKIE